MKVFALGAGNWYLEQELWNLLEKVPEFLLEVPIPGAESEDLHAALADLAAYSLVTRDAAGPFFLVHRLGSVGIHREFITAAAR